MQRGSLKTVVCYPGPACPSAGSWREGLERGSPGRAPSSAAVARAHPLAERAGLRVANGGGTSHPGVWGGPTDARPGEGCTGFIREQIVPKEPSGMRS